MGLQNFSQNKRSFSASRCKIPSFIFQKCAHAQFEDFIDAQVLRRDLDLFIIIFFFLEKRGYLKEIISLDIEQLDIEQANILAKILQYDFLFFCFFFYFFSIFFFNTSMLQKSIPGMLPNLFNC